MGATEVAWPLVLSLSSVDRLAGSILWGASVLLVMLFCAGAIPALAPLADRLHLVAHPSSRCVHDRPIAKFGGVVIFCAFVGATVVLLPISPFVSALLIGGAIVAFGGVIDDRSPLSWQRKIAVQILAITTAISLTYGGAIVSAASTGGPEDLLRLSIIVLGAFWLLLVTINASNLTDGLDGLLGGVSSCSLFALSILAHQHHTIEVGSVSVLLMACLVGFLAHNSHPAKIFLGDCGSQFVGFTVGLCILQILSVTAVPTRSPFMIAVFAACLVGYPFIDTLFVVLRRMRTGHHIFCADRRHLHHLLLDLGIPHGRVVQYLTLLQASFVGLTFAVLDL